MEWIKQSLRRGALIALLLLFVQGSSAKDDFDEELYSVIDSYRDGSLWTKARHARSVDAQETPRNESFSDNSLWNDLWYRCKKKPSFSCIKSGVFKYLDKNLDGPDDLEVTDHLFFRKNKNKYDDYCEDNEDEKQRCLKYNEEKLKISDTEDKENEIGASDETSTAESVVVAGMNASNSTAEQTGEEDVTEGAADGRSVDSLSDLSDILYDKGTQFLMTHDMEFQLPQTFFGGGSIKIAPKSFEFGDDEEEEDGTIVKVVFKPPPPSGQVVRGRVLHHLKKLFKKKLMHSFMALMLIIKMIKVKVMFLLPMIIGQSTAKKLLLKTLLFLIPGLAHLFKLCHYYHMEHAKYHHHHHKIKHHHHTVKVPVPVPVPVHHPHHHPEDEFEGYPSNDYSHYPPASYPPASYPPHPPHFPDYDYQSSGSTHGNVYGQYPDNEAALASWGLGTHNYRDAGVLDAKDQPAYSGYSDQASYYKKSPYGLNAVNSYGENVYYQNNDIANTISPQKNFYGSKLQFLSQTSGLQQGPDPFYSPIIQKIDDIFIQMGYSDEGCRERLVCSMYKNPHRFSPHSNLLSNELSRDTLQKPIANNEDVLRFYRYVQAARDGQEQKDCLHLYTACHVNTEG